MHLFSPRNRDDAEDPRRRFLVRALSMGLYASGLTFGARWAGAMAAPRALPPGRSIYRLDGQAWIDGAPAEEGSLVRPDADIVTGPGSAMIFVVGTDAFILRESSRLALAPVPDRAADPEARSSRAIVLDGLRLLSGKLLSVFGERGEADGPTLRTPVATIGIRGTGVYLESEPDRTYVCTCYGETELRSLRDAGSRERIAASHHDEPRYILADGVPGRHIEAAPVLNHTDMELELIEALVGRKPPFAETSRSRRRRY